MPLVTNLDSDDEGLLELVDGQEIIREKSQTELDALDDIDTDSNDEDRGLNHVGNGVPTSASKLGTVGKKHFSAGASRRMSMGSVATHGSMPEEYSFDHVGLDGRHTTTMHQPVSVPTAYSPLKNGGPKVVCEMDSVPQVDQKRSSRNSDAGSKSSRDVSVASLGTAPSYHAGKGPYISKGYGGAPIEDASMESGSLLSPYHAGQGPYIKGSLAPELSLSKQKKKKSSRPDKDLNPPTDVMVKRSDITGKRNSQRSGDAKKSSRSQKSSTERSRRSRPKTTSIATQTDISGIDIDFMQSKIDSQEAELNAKMNVENERDSTVEGAVHSLDLEDEEEDRASLLEQEVVEIKLQLAQAQADLQEAQLKIHRITKERDEALSMKGDADRTCEDLRKAMEGIQDDSRRERLQNQMQGTSSRNIMQKRTSLTSHSAESSHQGSKSGWRSSITSTGMFGGSSSYRRRGSYASSRGSMASHNNSIGISSGLLDVQNLSESDVEEPVNSHARKSEEVIMDLHKRDMAQQAQPDGGNNATDSLEKNNGSGSEQEVHDDDPFATVYNKDSTEDDGDLDKKRNGPFGFGLMRG